MRGSQLITGANSEGDTIDGGGGSDTIFGGVGNDQLIDGLGADILDGGAGDDRIDAIGTDSSIDRMTGGAGRDEFRFLDVDSLATAFAEDVITDFEAGDGGDRIIIGGSVANPFETGQLIVRKSGVDTIIQYKNDAGVKRPILRLLNIDPTLLTPYNFGGLSFPLVIAVNVNDDDNGNILPGSQDGDTIFGNGGSDTISGYGGNDSLAGGADADIVGGDEGDDWIAGQGGSDSLSGGAGNDTIAGGAGDDNIYGGEAAALGIGNDVFEGGLGDDRIFGGAGNDEYRYAAGDGRDVIFDAGGSDTLRFGAGIAAQDLSVHRRNGDFEIRFANSDDRVTFGNLINGSLSIIENFVFSDGTVWQFSDLLAIAHTGSSGDEYLEIVLPSEALGPNLLINGSFEEYDPAYTSQLSDGLRSSSIPGWSRAPNNSQFELVNSGTASIYATHGVRWMDMDVVSDNASATQTITGLSAGQKLLLEFDHANYTSATSGSFELLWNGQIIASFSDVGTTMLAEAFFVTAAAGSNTLMFRGTGTEDLVGAALDNVRLRAVSDLPYTPAQLNGAAGNDRLAGSYRDDILVGGRGDDALAGGLGDDRYLFAIGDGQDVIYDKNGNNRLEFGPGIAPGQVRVVRGRETVALEIIGTGDRVDLGSTASPDMGVREVRFADGTIWDVGTLIAMALAPTAGDDEIHGSLSNEIMTGAAGDDLLLAYGGDDDVSGNSGADELQGGEGSDIYRFGRGDGQDVIVDHSGAADAIFLRRASLQPT